MFCFPLPSSNFHFQYFELSISHFHNFCTHWRRRRKLCWWKKLKFEESQFSRSLYLSPILACLHCLFDIVFLWRGLLPLVPKVIWPLRKNPNVFCVLGEIELGFSQKKKKGLWGIELLLMPRSSTSSHKPNGQFNCSKNTQ